MCEGTLAIETRRLTPIGQLTRLGAGRDHEIFQASEG